jgi:hypothetical protein
MNSIFNDDFRDFVKALNDNKVEYILVGGYAVILHGLWKSLLVRTVATGSRLIKERYTFICKIACAALCWFNNNQ